MAEDKKADEATKSAVNGTVESAASTAEPPKPDLTAGRSSLLET